MRFRSQALPDEYRAERIVPAIGVKRIRGKRFLIPRAEVAREALPEILRANGAKEVLVAPAYQTVKPKGAQVDRMRKLLASGAIDLVTFTSSSTVTNFCDLLGHIRRRNEGGGDRTDHSRDRAGSRFRSSR